MCRRGRFRLEAFVQNARVEGVQCVLQLKEGEELECDRLLVSAGRVPNTGDAGLDEVGIETDERGFICSDAPASSTPPMLPTI